jgi:hypothetical protein
MAFITRRRKMARKYAPLDCGQTYDYVRETIRSARMINRQLVGVVGRGSGFYAEQLHGCLLSTVKEKREGGLVR